MIFCILISGPWMYVGIFGGLLLLCIIIIFSLIAGLVHFKNKTRIETEAEMTNVLYGMDYYEGSEIKESNPAYTTAHSLWLLISCKYDCKLLMWLCQCVMLDINIKPVLVVIFIKTYHCFWKFQHMIKQYDMERNCQ